MSGIQGATTFLRRTARRLRARCFRARLNVSAGRFKLLRSEGSGSWLASQISPKTLGLAIGLLCLFLPRAFAQEISIVADVDKQVIPLNEQLNLQVTVSGSAVNLPEPQLPSMPNFSVYSAGTSQNFAIINGHISGSVTYSYTLVPRFVGRTTIGPIAVTIQGKDTKTDPIEIQVVRPSDQPGAAPSPTATPAPEPSQRRAAANSAAPSQAPPGQAGGPAPVFVSASIDKHKVYVNEQATLSVRFYTAVSLLGNPEYVSPPTQGFLTEDLPPERHGQVRLQGRLYNYSEIKTALFAVEPGKQTIGPATVRCQVQQDQSMDPFAPDFFQKFFSQGLLQGQTKELQTDPLTLQAEPLPSDHRPGSFTGAVGRFRITAGLDRMSAKVGDAITLSVAVEGTGNLKILGAPKLPDLPSFRVYDTVITLNLNKSGDIVQGSKVFKTVLVPRASGELEIPSIAFSYFNPGTGEYVQEETAPIGLKIAPAPAGQTPAVGYISPSNTTPDITPLNEDIRYVKEPVNVSALSDFLSSISRSAWVNLLPLAFFLLLAATVTYRERLNQDPVRVRFRQALPKALNKIRKAETHLQSDPIQTGSLLADALTGFLADKFNLPPSSLTLRQVQDAIRLRFPKLVNDRTDALKTLWEELEQLRFAGKEASSPADLTSLLDQFQKLVKDLDRRMK